MALTRLSDVIIPSVYEGYGFVPAPVTLAFLNSPAVRRNAFLDSVANREGQITTIPFWNDLDASTDPNISTDNPADIAVPQKITASSLLVRVADYNNAWSAADLVADIAGSNPMQQIKRRTNKYWTLELQRFMASIAMGIAKRNIASNAGDMVNNISSETLTTNAANMISHNAVVDTFATNGEFFGELSAMIVPMTVYWNLVKQEAITYVQPSQAAIKLPVYGGQAAVLPVADSLLSRPGTTSGRVYYTILCGAGAFAFGQGSPLNPVEVKREALQGNGGGVEILVERLRWVLAATGHSFTSSSVASQSPTSAEWGLAANWNRVYPRNSIALAYLITNG